MTNTYIHTYIHRNYFLALRRLAITRMRRQCAFPPALKAWVRGYISLADTVMASYQPMPRFWHTSARVANKIVVYSGWTHNDSLENKKRLASIVEVYYPHSEHWEAKQSPGQIPAPVPVYGAASVVVNDQLYLYGGRDLDNFLHSLHKLSAKTYEWREVNAINGSASPMRKSHAAMVACGNGLALFGGYGIQHGPTKPGSSFIKNTSKSDSRGWTNEFHIYHLNEGMHTRT